MAWIRVLALLTAVVLPVMLLLCVPLSHDEHMYVAAGMLLREHALYADFAFLQAPYLPFLYAPLFSLAGGSHLLLCGRSVSLVMGLVAFYVVYRTCRELSGCQRIGALCMVLLAGHHLTLFVLPYARNHIVALALALVAFYLFIRAIRSPENEPTWFIATGVLSGLAVGTKLLATPLALALLVACVATPRRSRGRDRIVRGLLPFSVGLTLAVLPALWILATTDPEVALFNNVGYHRLNLLWRVAADPKQGMTFLGKLAFATEYLTKGSGAALLLALAFVVLRRRAARREPETTGGPRSGDALTVTALSLVAAALAAFLPTPMQRDYLLMIVPFVVILLAGLIGRWADASDRVLKQAIAGLAVLTLLVGVVTSLRHLRRLPYPESWTPTATRQAGRHLVEVMSSEAAPGKVATLAPIYPLEGGREIYRELATGPFLYRVGDLIESECLEKYVGSSPSSIYRLLAADPPDAILLGFEDELEEALATFARERGYTLLEANVGEGRLFLQTPSADMPERAVD